MEEAAVTELRRLIVENLPVALPGIALQEVLSGIRRPEQFDKVLSLMSGFTVLLADAADHVEAARVSNLCRRGGVATTSGDNLIAAQAIRHGASVWSLDNDFEHMAEHCDVDLYSGGLGMDRQ
jgi:predicted nucleic acid-binding protein